MVRFRIQRNFSVGDTWCKHRKKGEKMTKRKKEKRPTDKLDDIVL